VVREGGKYTGIDAGTDGSWAHAITSKATRFPLTGMGGFSS